MKNESFFYQAPRAPSPIIINVDHATNIVPQWINGGDLGISKDDMERHIAYDVGALGVAETLASAFDAHLIATQFSRLAIDPNRGEDDPTMIMKIYDRSLIAANRALSEAERDARLERLYRPYHEKLAELVTSIDHPIIIAMHSFTPQLRGRKLRPWHIGILSAEDRSVADPLIDALNAEGQWVVGDNEPYKGALKGDTMDRHGIHKGVPHALIEIRNDLIASREDQEQWGKDLYKILSKVLKEKGLYHG